MNKILPLILILNFGSLFSQSKENKLDLIDTWFGSSGTNNDKPIIVRGRDNLISIKESGLYNERVEMVWSIKNPTEDGLPDPELGNLMGEIEDAFVEILEKDLQTVLTIVYTHDKIRSWIFYTKSIDIFIKRLNTALADFQKIPIDISNAPDKDWDIYNQFLEVYKN